MSQPTIALQFITPNVLPADFAQVIVGPPGPPGPPGPKGNAQLVPVAQPISGHSVVAVDASGQLVPADCTNASHCGAVLGVVDRAYSLGESADVKTGFPLPHAGWAWMPGPVFLGLAGQLTQSLPPGALFSQVIGQAVSPTRVLIDVQPFINLA